MSKEVFKPGSEIEVTKDFEREPLKAVKRTHEVN